MHVHTASRCICETEKWNGGGREGERVSAGEMERGREGERGSATHTHKSAIVFKEITRVLRGYYVAKACRATMISRGSVVFGSKSIENAKRRRGIKKQAG